MYIFHWGDVKQLIYIKQKISISLSTFISLQVDTVPSLNTSSVISSLFCFNDTLTPLLIDNVEDTDQLSDRDNFQSNCEAGGNQLIQESIYTEDSITTRDITNTTECYEKLPCFHCEQEVIEIRRGTCRHLYTCIFLHIIVYLHFSLFHKYPLIPVCEKKNSVMFYSTIFFILRLEIAFNSSSSNTFLLNPYIY